MSKTITIDDDVYSLLSSLKQGAGDSFTKVLRRHVHKPAETAAELLVAYEHEPPPKADPAALGRLLTERGRRSVTQMIADTTFLIQFAREGLAGRPGPAQAFLAHHRKELVRTCIISLAEVATGFETSAAAWEYFKWWKIYALHRGIAEAAADVDRELTRAGQRLGENDNWIAGFCRYHREPVISADVAFDRVARLRRLTY